MKKSLLSLIALLCFTALFAQETDVNFALTSNGSSATASSGNAAAAIDDNKGSRWESEFSDPQWWVLDMGQNRTFNTIQIIWEGAYGKTFTISASALHVTFVSMARNAERSMDILFMNSEYIWQVLACYNLSK